MNIRPSTLNDLPILMKIYRQARQIQLDSGNLHQWVEGFPPEDLIRKDIADGVNYTIEKEGAIVGAFTIIAGTDPTYAVIEDGAWIDDELPYSTIHRLAAVRGCGGVARACFVWCAERCPNLRVDTHEDNAIMRRCIDAAGFRYCGIIHVADGSPRRAYQKLASWTEEQIGNQSVHPPVL